VTVLPDAIVTSSLAVGIAPQLQVAAIFQLPVLPAQVAAKVVVE